MTSDSAHSELVPTITAPSPEAIASLQVRLKSEEGRLVLTLPAEGEPSALNWSDLWIQLKQRLQGGDRFWQPNTTVDLMAADRLLDGRQLKAIADALWEVQLQLRRVCTTRRQTAVAAATAGYCVEQQAPPVSAINQLPAASPAPLAEPLYLQMTVRSGTEIRHPGTVVILGDLNPGGNVIADGDILVWGRLRGVAHAGASGNTKCLIVALQMEPTQLRIADSVARAPTTIPDRFYPEVAYVTPEGIRITKAADFSKSQFISKP